MFLLMNRKGKEYTNKRRAFFSFFRKRARGKGHCFAVVGVYFGGCAGPDGFFLCSLLFKHSINQLGREKTIGSTVNIVAWYAVGDDYARGGAVVAGCCVASVASVGGVFEGVLNEFVEGSLCSIQAAYAPVSLFCNDFSLVFSEAVV